MQRPNMPSQSAGLTVAQATREDERQPLTSTEEFVAGVWHRVLGAKALRGDDFFQLGGDSLGAAQVSSQLSLCFEVSLDLGLIFEHPILAEYAATIDQVRLQTEKLDAEKMVVIDRADSIPLSFLQEAIL
jgi:yersiniabactin nonribosomal peptide synthetase